ncbi:MAG: isocitrate lyase/PEP mutase family protein, partial [Nevskia sp.]|nr:isocitrate lyase/PEP mutase family protein [Nevskia sp.]
MTDMLSKSARLRSLLFENASALFVGVHNALGAQIGEECGFQGIWASGLELSAAAGLPDAGLLSTSDMLAAATQMDRATGLPVLCDCDDGFGSIYNVMHMVKEYEAAGIAGVCLEDGTRPKRNSLGIELPKMCPPEEFAAKIAAAKAT